MYFYDKATGKSAIKHPMDDYFFALVQEERRKAGKRKARNEVPDAETNLRQLWMPFQDETSGASYFYNFRKVRVVLASVGLRHTEPGRVSGDSAGQRHVGGNAQEGRGAGGTWSGLANSHPCSYPPSQP